MTESAIAAAFREAQQEAEEKRRRAEEKARLLREQQEQQRRLSVQAQKREARLAPQRQMAQMYRQGKSIAEIATVMKISRRNAYGIVTKAVLSQAR